MTIISELVDDPKFIIKFRRKYTRLQKKLGKKAPKAADMAPDFTLFDILSTESITLSDFRGTKPVALVFSGCT